MNPALLVLINALEPLALAELKQFGVISPQYANLIDGIVGAISNVLPLFQQGNTTSVSSVIAALQGSVTALQQTAINPTALAMTSAFLKAIQAGVEANASLTTVDPDKLQPIAPLA